jgi:hypothetical protein
VRILLDECLPRALARDLAGHAVQTVTQVGWSGVKNGELLRRAAGQFDVFLTVDQRLEQQAPVPRDLAVITLQASSNRIEALRPLVPAILQALEILTPGERVRIGRQRL